VIRVEQWAELRRLHFVKGLSIKEIQRRTGFHRQTIRRALRSERAPRYERAPRPSKLDPFREEIQRLLREEPRLPGTRVRELLQECGYEGGKTLVLLGGLPETLVWDREGALHACGGRPTDPFAAFLGELRLGWRFLEPHDPQARGVVERLQGYAGTSFEPGRRFLVPLDVQEQLDRWFGERANVRFHRTLRCRPLDRLAEEHALLRPLPARLPDVERRFVTRVPPDPYVRIDTCDYSLEPRLVGRRVEVRVSQREVLAACLDTGELACLHQRSFARHRTLTALEHARTLRQLRGQRAEPEVETRPLARYDALIPA
jgi:hypothetical protein